MASSLPSTGSVTRTRSALRPPSSTAVTSGLVSGSYRMNFTSRPEASR